MMTAIRTRMGDGYAVVLTRDELRRDLVAGSEDAARRAKIPVLDDGDIERLAEIFAYPGRIAGVEPGHEVVLTKDGCANTLYNGQMSSGVGIPMAREQGIRVMERAFGFDTMEVGHPDYSFKPAKALLSLEQLCMAQAQLDCVVPLFYGAMPNMGLYFRPDGPFANPADLLPDGRIEEARATQLEAAERLRNDMLYVSRAMAEVGADGIDFDTTGSAGDAEFLATLEVVEELTSTTDLAVEVGMATELVLGFHGELKYAGTRLAGLWPHQQLKVVERAGAHIFGPAVTTNTGRSAPWNVARAVTFVKECSRVATIPVHANVGMGVGGVPTVEVQPSDVVTRAGVALVEVGHADGL
jgi:dimethylamine---corrinoid protein Co-methyltransferase